MSTLTKLFVVTAWLAGLGCLCAAAWLAVGMWAGIACIGVALCVSALSVLYNSDRD
jgi:hypothetical protein